MADGRVPRPARRIVFAGDRLPRMGVPAMRDQRLVNSRWLFVLFDEVTMLLVVRSNRALRTAVGDAPGLVWRYCAATPAVCGVAIDVPLMVFVDVLVRNHADVMDTPGANQSTQLPKSLKLARASFWSLAPTVSASPTRE